MDSTAKARIGWNVVTINNILNKFRQVAVEPSFLASPQPATVGVDGWRTDDEFRDISEIRAHLRISMQQQ